MYLFEFENGSIMWEYNVEDLIIFLAYVDDNVKLMRDFFLFSERLVCICISLGRIYLFRVSCINFEYDNKLKDVKKFAEIDF